MNACPFIASSKNSIIDKEGRKKGFERKLSQNRSDNQHFILRGFTYLCLSLEVQRGRLKIVYRFVVRDFMLHGSTDTVKKRQERVEPIMLARNMNVPFHIFIRPSVLRKL